MTHPLAGIYAAAVTPLNVDQSLALDDIPPFLAFLAKRGCHGALLLGTTGEGPSFSLRERLAIFKAALPVWDTYPHFRLLAGTGTPSLEETIILSKAAFEYGYQGVVVLPPYYYHQATEDGIFKWFEEVIKQSVPEGGFILGYHFPSQSGVPIPLDVIRRLRLRYPVRFAGFKDSTNTAEHTHQIGNGLDRNLAAFVGNEIYLSQALEIGASGCITASANVFSPIMRKIWDKHQAGVSAEIEQAFINKQREVLSHFLPFPVSMKVLLSSIFGFSKWAVRSPLTPFVSSQVEQLIQEIEIP